MTIRCSSITFFVCFGILTLVLSCSSTHRIRPMEKGELAISADIGGPFAKELGWAPFPLLGLSANYGILDKIDIESGWEITSALFGVCEFEGGINWRPLTPHNWTPGLITRAKLLGSTDFKPGNSRLWPDIGLTALWKVNTMLYYYLGMDNWFETATIRYDGNAQRYHWLPIVNTGIDFGTNSWQGQIEGKWYFPNLDGTRHSFKTISIGKYGGIGIYIGVGHSFGKLGIPTRGKK